MRIRFKVIPNYKQSAWVGWFGDDVIKVRLTASRDQSLEALMDFIQTDLGIQKKSMKVQYSKNQNLITMEFPDVVWELFLSTVE